MVIKKNRMKIKNGGRINSSTFWEFKNQMDKDKNKETVTNMLNEKGETENTKEGIGMVFQKFYTNLFKTNEIGNTGKQREMEILEDILFKSIKTIGKNENKPKETISLNEVENNIKNLRNKHTLDCQGWNNKILKNGGKDLTNSINNLFKEININEIVPDEWTQLKMKSIYKNKGSRNKIENRRGLFIRSITSKLYERIKLKQNSEKINNGISKYQCGGTKGKSSSDNIMTLNAIIDYNKLINTETFILFADAYKCFDKLRIKNCIIDLYKIIGAKEAMDIYRMNEKGNAIINTTIGNIDPIEVNGIVRQGTIMGPKLCCIDTDKINSIGRKCITASSNGEQLEKAVINLQCMEETKGYTFNNDVNKTAILIINKKKNKKYNIEINIKNGL